LLPASIATPAEHQIPRSCLQLRASVSRYPERKIIDGEEFRQIVAE
jgi:hypothetical protein